MRVSRESRRSTGHIGDSQINVAFAGPNVNLNLSSFGKQVKSERHTEPLVGFSQGTRRQAQRITRCMTENDSGTICYSFLVWICVGQCLHKECSLLDDKTMQEMMTMVYRD